jgi:hypothetical protein
MQSRRKPEPCEVRFFTAERLRPPAVKNTGATPSGLRHFSTRFPRALRRDRFAVVIYAFLIAKNRYG